MEARSTCWFLVLVFGLMLVVLLLVAAVALVIAVGPRAKNPDKDRCLLFNKQLSTKIFFIPILNIRKPFAQIAQATALQSNIA